MAILLAYSTSSKEVCRYLRMAAIWKILKYQTQLQFGLSYKKIALNYANKSIFHGDDVINYVTGWPESCPLYSRLGELGSLREQVARAMSGQYMRNIVIVFRGFTCLKTISINNTFSISQAKGQRQRLTGLPWLLGNPSIRDYQDETTIVM